MSPGDDDHDLGIGAIERNGASEAADGPRDANAVSAVPGADAASAPSESSSIDSVGALGAADGASGASGLEEVSADLAAGAVSPAEAQARLIDEVEWAMKHTGTNKFAIDAVRAEVAALLADDPLLARLLDPGS